MIKPTFLININSVQRLLKVLGEVLYFGCSDVLVCMHTHLYVWVLACECHSARVEGRGPHQMSALTVHPVVWVGDSPGALLCTSSSGTYKLPGRDCTTPICTRAQDPNSGHHADTSKHFSLPPPASLHHNQHFSKVSFIFLCNQFLTHKYQHFIGLPRNYWSIYDTVFISKDERNLFFKLFHLMKMVH